MALKGNMSNQEFIVDVFGNTTTQRVTNKEVEDLDRSTNFTFKVYTGWRGVWVM